MGVNHQPRQRCLQCIRPMSHCLCHLLPSLSSRTRILVIQHPDEAKHALNTARFVVLGLRNARLVIAEHVDNLEYYLEQSDYQPCILFPGVQALELTAYTSEQKPLLLVVPDGTWRKARKILYANPILETLPRVTLPRGYSSRYRLRKAPYEESLATVEAVTHALEVLEPQTDFSPLLRPFDALIEGQIQAMGIETYQRNHVDVKNNN